MSAGVFLLGSYGPSLVTFRGALIAALRESGRPVIAAAPEIDAATAQALTALGAEPLSLPVERHGINPLKDLHYYARLRRILAERRPDVFLGYTAKPVVWGAAAARAAGVPMVAALITGLGYAFTEGREPKRRLVRAVLAALYRRSLRRCHRVMFQNPDDRADFAAWRLLSPSTPTTIVNGSGIDLSQFTPAPAPAAPAFLMVARLLKDKGVREYAAAAIALKRRHPTIAFRLAGWLDPSPDCVAPAELEGWRANGIEYLGRLADVRPAMAQASCYVLPSYREGAPRTVLEAMAMGRPVITTDAPGCRETVVHGDNGLLVPPRDAGALERAMAAMIAAPDAAAAMGLRSRRLAEEKYDVHAVNRVMMQTLGLA